MGSRYNILQLQGLGPAVGLQLGADTVSVCDQVWLLGDTIFADLVSTVVSPSSVWQLSTGFVNSPFSGQRVGVDACPRLRDVQGGLLQLDVVGRTSKTVTDKL